MEKNDARAAIGQFYAMNLDVHAAVKGCGINHDIMPPKEKKY